MNYIVRLITTCLLISAFNIQAKLVECSNCQSEVSYLNMAKMKGELVEGTSYLYVANSNAKVIKKFTVIYRQGTSSAGEPSTYRVYETVMDSASQIKFEESLYWRDSIEQFFDYNKDIPREVALSAWQLSGNPVFQRDIAIYYSYNQNLRERIANYAGTLAALVGSIVNANLNVSVSFSDGSTANFRITGIDSSGNITFQFNNAIDEFGNAIPSTPAQLEGQFRMNAVTVENYRAAVNSFRFTLSSVPNIQTGTVVIVDCTVNPSTKEVTCESKTEGGDNIP